MRTFGKDSPEFMEFKVEGDEKTYRLPLAGSIKAGLTLRLLEAMEAEGAEREALAQRFAVELAREYIGDAFADSVSTRTLSEVLVAWIEESGEAGQDAGE